MTVARLTVRLLLAVYSHQDSSVSWGVSPCAKGKILFPQKSQEQVLDQDSRRMSLSGRRPSKYLRGHETEGKEPIQGMVSSVVPGELQKSVWGVPQSDCIEQQLLRKGRGTSASSRTGPALGQGCWEEGGSRLAL